MNNASPDGKCLFCGSPPAFMGAFVPTESFRVEASLGRVVGYAICGGCIKSRGPDDIEDRIRELALQSN